LLTTLINVMFSVHIKHIVLLTTLKIGEIEGNTSTLLLKRICSRLILGTTTYYDPLKIPYNKIHTRSEVQTSVN